MTKKEKFQILNALGIDFSTVEKIRQITYNILNVKFVDGHSANFRITKNVSK